MIAYRLLANVHLRQWSTEATFLEVSVQVAERSPKC
jgi:hypothetical protein